jgi:hypothetical protein
MYLSSHTARMINPAPPAVPANAPSYRLRVRASPIKSKQFQWEIIDENRGVEVQTSERTFRSMAEAYDAGLAPLEQWRQRANRQLASSGALGQPKPGKAVR